MTRSIKTVNRPEPHIFDPDPEIAPDWGGVRFCRAVVPSSRDDGSTRRCALREDDSVHVTSEQLVEGLGPNPIADVDDRILGEG